MIDTHGRSFSRSGGALIVVGVHAVLVYAIATSLGIVEVPQLVKPIEAVLIDVPTKSAEPRPVEVKPQLAEPQIDVPMVETVPEIPVDVPLDAAPADAAIRVDSGEIGSAELQVTNRVEPVYPPVSRRALEEGSGVFKVLVDERGRPRDVTVAKSTGFARLDQAAVQAIRKWVFAPAMRGTQPVSSWTSVRVTFRLDK